MIGFLRGVVAYRGTTGEVMVEVAGVGYRLTVSPSTAVSLGDLGAEVMVHTSMQVREESQTLYGFTGREERDCFEALLGAHGVGPALALAILSVHRPAELRHVLSMGDIDALTMVAGVGRKTAARLLIELKSRLDGFDLDDTTLAEVVGGGSPSTSGGAAMMAEVRAALGGLGYETDEIRTVLVELGPGLSPSGPGGEASVEDLVRAALRLLGARR